MFGALALITGAALILAGCGTSGAGTPTGTKTITRPAGQSSTAPSGTPSSTKASLPAGPTTPVHVSINISDGAQVGVGMPIIASFKVKLTSGVAFQKATKVTVNGAPAKGAWYFEYSDPASGHLMEAHYRLQNYWPAHAQIHMDLPVKGLSAGPGLSFDDSLTSDFTTGAAHVSTVDDSTHTMTVMSDGKLWGKFPVSLGAPKTPTLNGVKVIMEKGRDISMRGPGYYDAHVKYTQRLTYGGEYLHSAPWNCNDVSAGCDSTGADHIGHFDSSNGCTNLRPDDAIKLYNFLTIGDVVQYPDASGHKMQLGDGFGDWNTAWPAWQAGIGSAVPTT